MELVILSKKTNIEHIRFKVANIFIFIDIEHVNLGTTTNGGNQ